MKADARVRALLRAAEDYAHGEERAERCLRRHIIALEESGWDPKPGWVEGIKGDFGFPDRETWLFFRSRLKTIGGSGAGAILCNSFEGEWGVYAPQHVKRNSAMSTGIRWESWVQHLYREGMGIAEPEPSAPFIICLNGDPHLHATPDSGRLQDVEGGTTGAAEYKVQMRSRYSESLDDYSDPKVWGPACTIESYADPNRLCVQPDYDLQCRLQMRAMDVEWVDLAVLFPFYDLRMYRIWRDREAEEVLVQKLKDWWQRHIVDGEPPEPDPNSNVCVAWHLARRAEMAMDDREATDIELDLIADFEDARGQKKVAERVYEEKRAALILTMGDASRLTQNNEPVAWLTGNNHMKTALKEDST